MSTRVFHTIFDRPIIQHILFWLVVLAYFVIIANIKYYSGYIEILEAKIILVSMQIIVAYTTLYLLIPNYLVPQKKPQLLFSLFFILVFVYLLFLVLMEFYYGPKYFISTKENSSYNSIAEFQWRIFSLQTFVGKSVKFLTPTVLLIVAIFYRERQQLLKLNEQKQANELNILKHQLNPHFLFNTLNNLYALSLNKSDKAPEVIAKLSEILDYTLYGCNDKYVSLSKEIELIENYLTLEKVRYSKRVAINFNNNITKDVLIAPLILLTFIENAFKHGVSQELKKALITISIDNHENYINFKVTNSIAVSNSEENKESIGLNNIKKQLDLLYSNTYTLTIEKIDNLFKVHLKLPIK